MLLFLILLFLSDILFIILLFWFIFSFNYLFIFLNFFLCSIFHTYLPFCLFAFCFKLICDVPHSACYYKVLSQLAFIHIPWERTSWKSEVPTKLKSRLSLPFYYNSLLVWLNKNSLIRRLWVIRKVLMRFTCYWRRTYIDSDHRIWHHHHHHFRTRPRHHHRNQCNRHHFRLLALFTMTVSHQVATKSLRNKESKLKAKVNILT